MKLYRTILIITAAMFAGAAVAAPSGDFNFDSRMQAMAYESPVTAQNVVAQNSNATTTQNQSLENKKHHSHSKLFHHKNKTGGKKSK